MKKSLLSRYAPLWSGVLLLCVMTLTACDNDPNVSVGELDGEYRIATLTFTPAPSALGSINVLSKLNTSRTSVEFFGNNTFALQYRLNDADESSSILGRVEAVDDNRIEVAANNGFGDERIELLLPQRFRLRIQDNNNVLTASIERDGVNLEAYDPDQYDGLGSIDGTLEVRLERGGSGSN